MCVYGRYAPQYLLLQQDEVQLRSLWAKIGLISDQSSYRILQDQDDKRIPIATGV